MWSSCLPSSRYIFFSSVYCPFFTAVCRSLFTRPVFMFKATIRGLRMYEDSKIAFVSQRIENNTRFFWLSIYKSFCFSDVSITRYWTRQETAQICYWQFFPVLTVLIVLIVRMVKNLPTNATGILYRTRLSVPLILTSFRRLDRNRRFSCLDKTFDWIPIHHDCLCKA